MIGPTTVTGVPEPRRVLVVDDDPMVRHAYTLLLSRLDGFEVCGDARDGAEGIERYAALQPDLVLMDLQMPVLSGIEATTEICRRWPDACVVVTTTFASSDFVVSALRAGAAGYLVKDADADALVGALHQALTGDMPMSASVRRALVDLVLTERPSRGPVTAVAEVSPRELELLGWLAQGLTNRQIGTRMLISEGSVKQHLSHLGPKLGTSSRTGILIRAVQLGLIDPHEGNDPSAPG